ncbi:MAG: hypothetical protein NTY79_04665 [Chloroflexi bacterium]|nr:hypothetical protein [Chloroflexota bacterium]
MFKRLATIKIGVLEFVYKFLLVLFVIMPVCMGICFWIGVQADAALNIHLLKFIMPFIGSAVGFFFTALLIQAGHKREAPATAEESVQPYSDRLVSSHVEAAEVASLPKPSIPRAGFATPYSVQGGK